MRGGAGRVGRVVGLGGGDAAGGAVAAVARPHERQPEQRAALRAAHAGGRVEQRPVVAFGAVGAQPAAVVAGQAEFRVADAADAPVPAAVCAGGVLGEELG